MIRLLNKVIQIFLLAGIIPFTVGAQIPDKAEDISPLLIGESIPETTLVDAEGSQLSTSSILGEKPSVIIFYRGGWCPYCNVHLSDIQKIENRIIEMGFQIIAVSPDSPDMISDSYKKHDLSYRLFSDSEGALARNTGIAFKAEDRRADMLNKRSDGLNEGFLPVPAVFVTDTSGKIEFEYINPDYSTRISSELLLAVLQVLTEENK